ncbi:DUF2637 domain-containing protein [Kitasatospora sp. NPDC036755]|uniref:DUF2637 domain-containing protein n=1 Tax=Kitasatospora sp. NPDC036755 TaxID=3154600 RepID=UPI0033F768D1
MQHDQHKGGDQPNVRRQLATLTPGMRRLVKAAGAGGALIAAIGFVGSYKALQKLAEKQGEMGSFSYAFPIGVDVGIAVLLALDLVLTWLRIRFPLLRYVAWMLTAGTIAFNAASAYPKPLPMALHALLPVLFVAVVEAGRYAIARIAAIEAGRPDMDGVRFFRWILSPIPTFKLWRKMKLWEITSYNEIVDLEQRRLVYRAILRHKYGRGWRRTAPVEETLPLKLSRYGRALPYLEPPETDLLREYTVERADRSAPAAAAELPPGFTPELLDRLTQLLDQQEGGSIDQQPRISELEAAAEPVPAEPVELVEAELEEESESSAEQPAATPYGGMVPLRKLDRPVPEADSSWFRPEQTDPASALWDGAHAQVFDQEAAERPSAAELTRPASVHARLSHQETVPAPVVEQALAEPVAPWSPPVQPPAEPTGPLAEPATFWSPPVQPAVEPTGQVVEQPAAPSVQAEHGDQQPEHVPQLPDDQEEEPETPALSGKEQLLKLLQSLTPEQKAMNQKELAAELFPQLNTVMRSQDSVRVYIGRYMREGKI